MVEQSWDIRVLYDGECPLCVREINMLRRFNRRGLLALEDIAEPGFEPARYGRTFEELMGQIHGVLPDGSLITGVEVFRRAYKAVGLGFVLAPTTWPGVRSLADRGYTWFAKNRLRLTGRPECTSDRCVLPSAKASS